MVALTRLIPAQVLGGFNTLTEREWQQIAAWCARPGVANAIIAKAMETPYLHLDGYMNRYWVFNPYPPRSDGGNGLVEFPEYPSIRVHHILRADDARDPHNHPWDARTIVLKGWYMEDRLGVKAVRAMGDTAAILADTYHTVEEVSPGGVWTLFFTGRWQHTWSFRTPEGDVPWREYLQIPQEVTG